MDLFLFSLPGGVSEHEFAGKFHLGISHSFLHYFQNGIQCGYLVEKNLDFMDFLCISLGSEKNNHPILLS